MNLDVFVPPAFPAASWHFDASGYYAYVMVNGSREDADNVRQSLDQHKVKTMLLGRSYRPADDGLQYNWYLRMAFTATGSKPAASMITGALGTSPRAVVEARSDHDTVAEIQRLKQELIEARQALQTVQDHRSSLQAQIEFDIVAEGDLTRRYLRLKRLRDEARNEVERLKDHLQGLELQVNAQAGEIDRLNEVRARTAEGVSSRLSERNAEASALTAALQDQLAEMKTQNAILEKNSRAAQEEWIAAGTEAECLNEKMRILQTARDNALAERDHYVQERDEIATQIQSYKARMCDSPGAANDKELQRWLKLFLPNLELTEASFACLHNEIPDPMDAFEILRNLDTDPESIKGKAVNAAPGWFDRHFNTGESNLGRIYFKNIRDNQYSVHIGHKDTQMHDLGQLRDLTRQHKKAVHM